MKAIHFITMNFITPNGALSVDIKTLRANNYVDEQEVFYDRVKDTLKLVFITENNEKLRYEGYVPDYLYDHKNGNSDEVLFGFDEEQKIIFQNGEYPKITDEQILDSIINTCNTDIMQENKPLLEKYGIEAYIEYEEDFY